MAPTQSLALPAKLMLPAGFALLIALVAAQRAMKKGDSQLLPRKVKKPKKKAKGAAVAEGLETAPPMDAALSAECYAAKKAASGSTAAVVSWLQHNAKLLVARHLPSAPVVSANLSSLSGLAAAAVDAAAAAKPRQLAFSVLSVGCGDGELDVELISALSAVLEAGVPPGAPRPKLHYVGVEPNGDDAAACRAKMEEARKAGELSSETVAYVLEETFEVRPPKQSTPQTEQLEPAQLELLAELDEKLPTHNSSKLQKGRDGAQSSPFRSKSTFDLVVVANVLPYFRDTQAALQRLVGYTKSGGNLLIINSTGKATLQLQTEHMRFVKGSESQICTHDDIKKQLAQQRLQFQLSTLESRLNCTECLARTPTGLQVLSHCLESDVRRLCERKMMRLLKTCWELAIIEEDGSAFWEEATSVYVVEKPSSKK